MWQRMEFARLATTIKATVCWVQVRREKAESFPVVAGRREKWADGFGRALWLSKTLEGGENEEGGEIR